MDGSSSGSEFRQRWTRHIKTAWAHFHCLSVFINGSLLTIVEPVRACPRELFGGTVDPVGGVLAAVAETENTTPASRDNMANVQADDTRTGYMNCQM